MYTTVYYHNYTESTNTPSLPPPSRKTLGAGEEALVISAHGIYRPYPFLPLPPSPRPLPNQPEVRAMPPLPGPIKSCHGLSIATMITFTIIVGKPLIVDP